MYGTKGRPGEATPRINIACGSQTVRIQEALVSTPAILRRHGLDTVSSSSVIATTSTSTVVLGLLVNPLTEVEIRSIHVFLLVVGSLAGWLVGWFAVGSWLLDGRLLVGWLVSWLAGRLVGWSAGRAG